MKIIYDNNKCSSDNQITHCGAVGNTSNKDLDRYLFYTYICFCQKLTQHDIREYLQTGGNTRTRLILIIVELDLTH